MPIDSRFSTSVPNCSIQQWIFGSPSGPLPDKKAFVDADQPQQRYFTYDQARLLAKRIAVGLIDNGLQPGDRVLLFAGNSIFFPTLMMGVWMAGGIFTGANPGYVTRELAHQLQDSEATFMIAAESVMGVAMAAASQVGMKASQVFLLDSTWPDSIIETQPREGRRHWTKLIAPRSKGESFIWDEPKDSKNSICTLNYSSGTTGIPKGVEISHYNHVANSRGVTLMNRLNPDFEARRQHAAALCFLPMYHAFSQGYFITSFPYERIPVYIMPSFDFPKMLAHIQNFRITKLLAVPPILVLMSKHPLARRADLSSIDMIASGAAPLAKDTQREIAGMIPMGESVVRQGWGMTEATCTALSWDPSKAPSSAAGELTPDSRARLVNIETGDEITSANTPGELWITGPTVMRGYWRNSIATREAFVTDSDGTQWLRTGDVAYVEEYKEGTLFHIVDRVKELIKVKGMQVAPAELESLLLEREDIADAAVIGVTIDGEEFPRAYVVKSSNGKDTSKEDITDWLASRVVKYKQLRGGLVFVDAIPKVPSGKILRKTLRERAKREVSNGLEVRAKL
ncbi:related to 4-coumarate--CoA ligase [Fusarium torulosum]|uniref:Related to 4-coumarate--CoA ligase n=1 Tax=Fusarium torulosum TaxID=33205 RepID=A0AAE8ML75_9HYPO|nr:related to 4-coumarate--CoA ligase [Fusarium torulosum]